MTASSRKSAVLRKAKVLKVGLTTLYRHLTRVGEAEGLAEIKREIAQTNDDELLTCKEVAAILKCSKQTVYRFAEEGGLPHRMVLGRLFRVHASDLKKAIQESEYWHEPGLEA